MAARIAIVDYGMGNLRSVAKACEHVGMSTRVTGRPQDVAEADAIIVPGVGSFGNAIDALSASGMRDAILQAIGGGKPYLGICLGLQLLADVGEEDGEHEGLGVISGRCVRLPDTVKVPHMGWNQVRQTRPSPLFAGIPEGTDFYFVHSYHLVPDDPRWTTGVTYYGREVLSAAERDTLFAVQFHPEKSGSVGLALLGNFHAVVKEVCGC